MKSAILSLFLFLLANICFGGSPPKPDPDAIVASVSLPALPEVRYESIGGGESKAKDAQIAAKEHAEAQIKLQFAAAMSEAAAGLRQSATQLSLSTQTMEADRLKKLENIKKLRAFEEHMLAQKEYGQQMKDSKEVVLSQLQAMEYNNRIISGQLNAAYGNINYANEKLNRFAKVGWIPIIGPMIALRN